MNWSFNRSISFVMLIIFVISVNAWSFNAKRISHEVGHDRKAVHIGLSDHSAHHRHDHDEDHEANVDAMSDTEHDLLHAASQIQPAPSPSYAWPPTIRAGALRLLLIPPQVAHSTREPPFRPPRAVLS